MTKITTPKLNKENMLLTTLDFFNPKAKATAKINYYLASVMVLKMYNDKMQVF